MENIKEEELKQLVSKQLKQTLDNWKQPTGKITFTFICDKNYKPKIELKYIFGRIYYNDICIGDKELAPKVIEYNFHFNEFALIDEKHKTTDVKNWGWNENWAEEYHKFIYYRIPDKK